MLLDALHADLTDLSANDGRSTPKAHCMLVAAAQTHWQQTPRSSFLQPVHAPKGRAELELLPFGLYLWHTFLTITYATEPAR